MLLVKTAQERVVGFLLEMAERAPDHDAVELPMSRQDIADYLGLTIETVSRTLTMLESDGAIELPTSRCVDAAQALGLGPPQRLTGRKARLATGTGRCGPERLSFLSAFSSHA